MHKAFYNIFSYLKNHKIIGFSILLAYTIFISFFAWNINLEEDITKLIPSGEKQQLLKKILKETDFSDKLIVSISAESEEVNPDSLVLYANEFTDILEEDYADYILEIKGKVPEKDIKQIYNFVYGNLPIFLDESDYSEIENRLYRDSINDRIASGYRQLMSPTGFVTKDYFLSDPLNFTNLGLAKLQELQVGDNFSIYKNYLVTKDKKNIILFLDPKFPASETNQNQIFIDSLQITVDGLNQSYSTVKASYFGGVLYSLANANRIKSDIQLTMGIAISLLLLLLIFFYRKIYVPLLLFLPSMLAGVSAIAVLSIFKESVSAISLGIGAILLGVTLDYALHILTHFRNNRNVKHLYRDITKPVLMSSITTAIAFLCLIFVQSEALNDLGIFAAISVLLSSVFALTLIPVFYNPGTEKAEKSTFLDKIASVDYSKLRPLVIGVVAVFIVSIFFFNKVEFNNDLSKLNYKPSEIKKLEKELEALAGRSGKSVYMVAYGNTVDEALQQNSKLYQRLQVYENDGLIKNFSSIGGVIHSTTTQAEKIENWDSFWLESRKDSTKADLISVSSEYGFRPETFDKFYDQLNTDFKTIGLNDYKNAGSLYLDDFISDGEELATVTSTVSLEEEKSDEFISNFEDETGVFALDRKAMNQSFLGNLRADFNKLIMISVLAVFIVLLISYRNLEISLFTLLPIAITWICALGIMAMLDIEFNILNIIISTFIFGLGLDYSIFITNACLNEYETGNYELKTYQTSILISVITTLLGMGALIFAQHPALRSVSVVSIIGVITAVAVSFVIQRAIFRKLILNRTNSGKAPLYLRKLGDYKGRISQSESEKLYRKRAVMDNFRYKSSYSLVKKRFRIVREKNLRISRYIEDGESITVINSGYGIIPLFLSYKFETSKIHAFESDMDSMNIAKSTGRSRTSEIKFYNELENLPETKVYVIHGNFEQEKMLKDIIQRKAEKVIFIDSDFPNRWLLDLNFEIIYRQNNIMVFRKAE
ncbi:MMPL family transporter [Christiangramia sp. SM2212]|uniref:MMPL family transporter n=1 Tax=Christiangramia sediminicola TaxID=3073267 RepID=A0ABU1EPL5_9FLAO|nr:MMPL family transporter [Christiangramia sp. SM2212]MDR5590328.1 MMPL family transporter [Christiangramia sp. SM2212]